MNKPKVSLTVKDQNNKVTKIADDINNLSPEAREIAVGIVDTLAAAGVEKGDLFLWANRADAQKQNLRADLFLFTKNYTVYSLANEAALEPYLKALFLYDAINTVVLGAGTGMAVREIHTEHDDENVIDYVDLENVPNAQAVIEQIAYGEEQVEIFNEDEHELKRVIGIVVRFTPEAVQDGESTAPFYIVKQLQQSAVLSGNTAWALQSGKVGLMPQAAAIKIGADNQVLIADERVFAYNVTKFTKLFGYDAKRKAILDGKISEIEKGYKLSFPEGVDLTALARHNAALTEKLLKSTPGAVSQEQIIEQADKFQLALMTDDNGAIIIMDGRDAVMFANLLNDDYVESDMTDKHYLAVKKKEVYPTEDQQMNLGA